MSGMSKPLTTLALAAACATLLYLAHGARAQELEVAWKQDTKG